LDLKERDARSMSDVNWGQFDSLERT
jgi:hypothetical protein